MSKPSHVFVTAAAGRIVPIAASDASLAGGALLRCTEGKVYRLPYSSNTRRRILAGDLELCTRAGARVTEPAQAAAPEVVELDEHGALAAELELEAAPLEAPPAKDPSVPRNRNTTKKEG